MINLEDSTERRKDATRRMQDVGLDFEIFPAVDLRGTDPSLQARYSDRQARFWYGRSLNGGELGCGFSHLNAMADFLESDAEILLMLEDDVVPVEGFKDRFDAVLDDISQPDFPPWHAINLGREEIKRYMTPVRTNGGQICKSGLLHAHLFPTTTHCIMWSRAGAVAFLEDFELQWKPIDHMFRRFLVRRGTGLALAEPIARQLDEPSDIDRVSLDTRAQNETRWYWFNVWRIKRAERPFAKWMRRKFRKASKVEGTV